MCVKGKELNICNFNLESRFLIANISTLGATIRDLKFKNNKSSLILKYKKNIDYINDENYLGCTVGRYANRLTNNTIKLNKTNYNFYSNNKEKSILHSGKHGFNFKNWNVLNFGKNFVSLGLFDKEIVGSFPGNLYANCIFIIFDNKLIIIYLGTTDKTTLCNITNHTYFCLDNSGKINNHFVKIFSNKFLPTDNDCIPTGEILSVKNTKYDFETLKKINQLNIDNNYCFENTNKIKKIAFVKSSISNFSMSLYSSATGVQFYTGHNLKKLKSTNKNFSPRSGFCLETQSWPNSPNNKNFPSAILLPKNKFFQMNIYSFKDGY